MKKKKSRKHEEQTYKNKLTKLYNPRKSRERACRASAKTQSLCFKILSWWIAKT